MGYLNLALFGLVPVLITLIFSILLKKTKFNKLNYWLIQIIIGVTFGGIAVLSTEFGVRVNGAVMNARDAAPIAAGLFFGLPAGIIAGVIGGVERFLHQFWVTTDYTFLACSTSTIISGVVAGLLNQFIFKKEMPNFFQALFIGMVLETSHIVMIFITHVDDPYTAYKLVDKIGNPMIVVNGISVMLSCLVTQIFEYKNKKENRKGSEKKRRIATILHISLFCTIAFSYANVALFTHNIQTHIANSNSINEISESIHDVSNDIGDSSDSNLLSITKNIASNLNNNGSVDNYYLKNLLNVFNVSEINVVNTDGVIAYSSTWESDSNPGFVGYVMADEEQSAEFLVLLDGTVNEFVQAYRAIGASTEEDIVYMKYAGVVTNPEIGAFVQVGYDTSLYYGDLEEVVELIAKNRHIGQDGFVIVADDDYKIVSSTNNVLEKGTLLSDYGFAQHFFTSYKEGKRYSATINEIKAYFMYTFREGYFIIGALPQSEVTFSRNMSTYVSSYLEFIVFAIIFLIIYTIISRYVLDELKHVNKGLNKITQGELDTKLEKYHSLEFKELSNSINSTVDTLKDFIAKEAERIDKELALAKTIQLSSLPTQVAYLSHHEFDVYATMKTAKEVGGDFYDYFPLDNDRFAIVMADVSGKGIPAALFMMRTKSLIKSLLETGLSVDEVMNRANNKLCVGNDTNMFVTCWVGVIFLSKGLLEYANAGHNPPLLKHNGTFTYLRTKPNFVLGAMENMRYAKNTFQFETGDSVFLYTDGITEAVKNEKEMYGEKRLEQFINSLTTIDPTKIVNSVLDNTIEFTEGHEQSDDMTLLSFSYYGKNTHYRFDYSSTKEEYLKAQDDLKNILKSNQISDKIIEKFNLALEEIFMNVVLYGYKDKPGNIILTLDLTPKQATLTIIDECKQFNPLAKPDPDITLSAEERPIGGLGILMVKKLMDSVHYTYQEKHNILMMSMYIDEDEKGE